MWEFGFLIVATTRNNNSNFCSNLSQFILEILLFLRQAIIILQNIMENSKLQVINAFLL